MTGLAAHLPVLPIVLPFAAGAIALVMGPRHAAAARWLVHVACLMLLAIAAALLVRADGPAPDVYLLGNWPAPFGIVLVVDRLSALMVALTALLGLAALLHAPRIGDGGPHFHALWAFQLAGLAGAFLTGDLFNLFVFFEVLLGASYGLLLHGGGARRSAAALHYVTINLVASGAFLLAAGMIYAASGTLNMADIARRVPQLADADRTLFEAGALLLVVVFGVKAAALPLNAWLPSTYGAAPATVAALFGIMTKVGVYAMLRFATLALGTDAGPSSGLASGLLLAAGLATVAAGMAGVLAARTLARLAGYLVIVSAGTMQAAIGVGRPEVIGGVLLYLANSTLACAALYLLVDHLRRSRGALGDAIAGGALPAARIATGAAFFAIGMSIAGLPPLAGFVGKVRMLSGAIGAEGGGWLMALLLASGLASVVALARAGSRVFWNDLADAASAAQAAPAAWANTLAPADDAHARATAAERPRPLALLLLLSALVLLAVTAGPVDRYATAAARDLVRPAAYVDAVLSHAPVGSQTRGGSAAPLGLPAPDGSAAPTQTTQTQTQTQTTQTPETRPTSAPLEAGAR